MNCDFHPNEEAFVENLINGQWLCLDCAAEEGCPDAIMIRAQLSAQKLIERAMMPTQEARPSGKETL